MRKIVLILTAIAALCATGCANTPNGAWYSQAFIGYRLTEDGGFESCSKENTGMRLGYERRIARNWRIAGEYEHVSHLLCGKPFNDKADDFTDHVGIVVTYGGLE